MHVRTSLAHRLAAGITPAVRNLVAHQLAALLRDLDAKRQRHMDCMAGGASLWAGGKVNIGATFGVCQQKCSLRITRLDTFMQGLVPNADGLYAAAMQDLVCYLRSCQGSPHVAMHHQTVAFSPIEQLCRHHSACNMSYITSDIYSCQRVEHPEAGFGKLRKAQDALTSFPKTSHLVSRAAQGMICSTARQAPPLP